ncbi:ATP-binding protein [Leptolyngbya sp. AN03gr2]|uniref:ATP-binding protein n=1 Tax=unclassified Leptolyngbya TaxID=2650499 RepID=UPI003D319027
MTQLNALLREPAEIQYADDLAVLTQDTCSAPANWQMSPLSVQKFILGDSTLGIKQKWFGPTSLVQNAITTLASRRGLMLVGSPGTGKSWLSELLAAAICGNSERTIQGTAGTSEDQIKYNWNIAMVIANGQSEQSLIPSPVLTAMHEGSIARFEELTRTTSDVQDALISILSEKELAIAELNLVVRALQGFNIIATANDKDRGVNELSSALMRRFNFLHIPVMQDARKEQEIVLFRTEQMLRDHQISAQSLPPLMHLLLNTFEALRKTNAAVPEDQQLESSLSTAEVIGSVEQAILSSSFFGNGTITPTSLASATVSTLLRKTPGDVSFMNKFWNSSISSLAASQGGRWSEFFQGGETVLKQF